MKKRIGNDISFIWHISRCEGGVTVPESFAGKDVVVELLSPTRATAQIEDVEITDGTVRFTFPGRNQTETGNYTAVLYENRGENGMVTLDVVRAVTLVAHSFQETEDEGGSITAESVEFESSISNGSGGDAPIDVYTRREIDEKLRGKQNTLTAGENITIEGNVISSAGGGIRPVMWNDLAETELTIEQVNGVPLYWNMGENLDAYYIPVQQSVLQNYTQFADDAGTVYPTASFRVFGIWSAHNNEEELDGTVKVYVYRYTSATELTRFTSYLDVKPSAVPEKILDILGWNKEVSASDVPFNNTRTGLSATNVQDAIDEMADTNLYETVVLTVGSADSSFNPVGQTITVTLEDGSATQYTVPMSRQITFIVQRGMRYNISGTSTDDYRVLPISVKAAIPTRYLTMRYIPIATGVFILQKDGNYYLREEYDAETMAEDAVGVLVLTSALINAGFGIILSKSDANESVSMRAGNIILTTTDYTHYVGKSNTNTIYSQYPNNTFPIVNKAITKSITYGEEHTEQGYVASYAEGNLLLANATEINRCLILIGGVGILSNTWSSSYIVTTGRCLKNWSNVALNYEQQTSTAYNRPIYQYPLS